MRAGKTQHTIYPFPREVEGCSREDGQVDEEGGGTLGGNARPFEDYLHVFTRVWEQKCGVHQRLPRSLLSVGMTQNISLAVSWGRSCS